MKFIQELDSATYTKLRSYEQEFKEPSFLKAVGREPTVLVPKKETHGHPMMILPPLLDQPNQKLSLLYFLQSYTALAHSEFYQRQVAAETKALKEWYSYSFYDKCSHYIAMLKEKMGVKSNATAMAKFHSDSFEPNPDYKPPIPFLTDEYERYMQLINNIDPVVYAELKKYETDFSEPALLKPQSYDYDLVEEKNDYPLLVIDLSADQSEESQKLELDFGINIWAYP